MSSIAVLTAAWLIVIGYGLVYVGQQNLIANKSVSFQQAFFGGGLGGSNTSPSSTPSSSGTASSSGNWKTALSNVIPLPKVPVGGISPSR